MHIDTFELNHVEFNRIIVALSLLYNSLPNHPRLQGDVRFLQHKFRGMHPLRDYRVQIKDEPVLYDTTEGCLV
jgi:hypothetical protein